MGQSDKATRARAAVAITPDDYRRDAAKCLRLIKGAGAPVLKQLLRERAQALQALADDLERAETLTALEPAVAFVPRASAKPHTAKRRRRG